MKVLKLAGCCLALLLACGCASIYQSLMENSPVVLAYADPGVKEQAQVGTLFINRNYGLWLNGQEITANGGRVNPAWRVSKNLTGGSTTMIDVLPGTYRVAVMGSISEAGVGRTYTTTSPVEQTYSFLPGKVYSIELMVGGIRGNVLIREMASELTQTAVNNRNKAVF